MADSYTQMSTLLANLPDSPKSTESPSITDKDFNVDTWQYITKMLDIEMQFTIKTTMEDCLGYASTSGIGVLTPEAVGKIRAFISRNKAYEIGVLSSIQRARGGSIDSMHLLDTIINPYDSFMGKGLQNDVCNSVHGALIGKKPQRIKIFIKMPDIGD